MSITAIFLAVILVAGIGWLVALPIMGQERDRVQPFARGTERQNRAMETLWAEKLRVLREIRDLDFDYDMNKLAPDMYAAQRIQLVRLAAAIMTRLDELDAEINAQQIRVERALAEFRQQKQEA